MAAQERDDEESTGGLPEEPAGRAGAGGSTDQPPSDQARSERPPAGPPVPEPGELAGPEGAGQGPAEPSAGPPVGPAGTSILPPVSGAPPSDQEPPRWAARAQVPTPRVEDYRDEWVTEPPRSVLFPVLITAAVILLLGVAGLGVWLVLNNRPDPSPTESSPTTTVATSASPSPTTPTTTTSSATPSGIEVPSLIGQEYADAAQTLGGLGLEPVREDIFHDTIPAGQVIATDPTAGSRVAAGEVITVFVSQGPEPTASPSESPTTSAEAT